MSLDITPVIANHVLHFFNRDEGFTPGGFFSAFYELLAKADAENVTRLSEGFPKQVNAFLLARKSEEGMNQLREIARTKLVAV
jgi:hypothetical protein